MKEVMLFWRGARGREKRQRKKGKETGREVWLSVQCTHQEVLKRSLGDGTSLQCRLHPF